MNRLLNRRHPLIAALSLATLATLPTLAAAQAATDYPTKTITFVVPYAAGGSSDIRSRQIAQKLSIYFGKPVIVDNRPGAGGNIGTDYIAKAAPDGHVIGLGNFAPLAVNKALFAKLPFDPATDLVPVAMIERGPLVMSVSLNSPMKTAQDVVARAKAKPGTMTFASGGLGGSHHLAGEAFEQSAKVDMVHVAYKGGAPATNDLIAGNVDIMFEWIYAVMPYLKGDSAKLRPLAITSDKRSPLLPDVPTFNEIGIQGMEMSNWFGVVAPKGTPPAVVAKLNQAINKAIREPDVAEKITSQGNEVAGGTPEAFATFIRSESDRWSKLVKSHNIKPE
ncbi:tripartite tricarboxylate transporter substrate binding protein [Variovorax sp. J22R133]|uniref:Bug family tripartite tricarboxylate transporter substrate binding protein n=1 Tax=Variovorax brevis TaxID=3053503 RepID=UPI002576D5EF|nr:tripartite tricarboxylate transporter substrate binding protein [Variovorax sp. J22R133]MDM0114141.1 tripartite tricarboxylate transporter substrate binding protein [Variovorax sp. J22R133]